MDNCALPRPETAQIDAVIEKKQKLIELLKEKRQSLITKAVTKGLDPNAKMKDSGWSGWGDPGREGKSINQDTLFGRAKETGHPKITLYPLSRGDCDVRLISQKSTASKQTDHIRYYRISGLRIGDIYMISRGHPRIHQRFKNDENFNIWSYIV